MALSEYGLRAVQKLRAQGQGQGMSDITLLKAYLDARQDEKANPLQDQGKNPMTPDEAAAAADKFGIGPSFLGGTIGGAVHGIVDSVNPTPWDYESAYGESKGARLAGNIVGTVGTFAVPALGAAKLAKAGLIGAKTAAGLDLGVRGYLGGMQGYRGTKEIAEATGKDLDSGAAAKAAMWGALGNMAPLDFVGPKFGEGLISKALPVIGSRGEAAATKWLPRAANAAGTAGVVGLTGKGMLNAQAQQMGQDPDAVMAEALKNPITKGMLLGAPLLAMIHEPAGFHFSPVNRVLEQLKGAKAGATDRLKARIKVPGQKVESTNMLGDQRVDTSAVPPQAGPMDNASLDAIARALQAPEDLPDVVPSVRDANIEQQKLKDLNTLASIQAALKSEGEVSPLVGDLYMDEIPGITQGRQRVYGRANRDWVLDNTQRTRVDKQDAIARMLYLINQDKQVLPLGHGVGPLSGARIQPDTLEEAFAAQLGIGRDVGVFGQKGGKEYSIYDTADKSPRPKTYPVPAEALPKTRAERDAMEARKAAAAKPKGEAAYAQSQAANKPMRVAGETDLVKMLQQLIERYPEEMAKYLQGLKEGQ